MSDAFVGEIRLIATNFAPNGWALCNGQLLMISQNTALYALLGTRYGGDGKTTFALPDFRNKVPMQYGQGPGLTNRTLGQTVGSATVTLMTSEVPPHTHAANAAGAQTTANPQGAIWANSGGATGRPLYATANASVPMSPQAIGVTGGSQPHNNMQPYVGLNFIIALQGIFPPRG